MIKKTKKDTLRVLKNCIHYIKSVDIYGEEAIEVAECLQFLMGWAKLAGLKGRELERLEASLVERKKKTRVVE